MSYLHHAKSLFFQPPDHIPIPGGSGVGVDAEDRRDACLVLALGLGLVLRLLLSVAWAGDGSDWCDGRGAAAGARLPSLLQDSWGDVGAVLAGDCCPERRAVSRVDGVKAGEVDVGSCVSRRRGDAGAVEAERWCCSVLGGCAVEGGRHRHGGLGGRGSICRNGRRERHARGLWQDGRQPWYLAGADNAGELNVVAVVGTADVARSRAVAARAARGRS